MGAVLFALDVVGVSSLAFRGLTRRGEAKGSARLAVTAVLPFSPPDAQPVVRSATLEAAGGRTELDSVGNALGR